MSMCVHMVLMWITYKYTLNITAITSMYINLFSRSILHNTDLVAAAFRAAASAVRELVNSSVGGRLHNRALACLTVMRQEAVSCSCWEPYNTALERLANTYRGSDVYGEFWARVVAERSIALPVCDEEVAGCDKTRAQAEAWLREHGVPGAQEDGVQGGGAATVGQQAAVGMDADLEEMA